jgi:photosystem II stability/assembly factor-like uncharacterized protein
MKNVTNPIRVMSGILLFFIPLLFLPITSHAQQCDDAETWVNPVPQGNNLTFVDFINSTTGYASGLHGTIIKTTDGGNNWSLLNTGTKNDLNHFQFVNSNTAFAVGANGTMLKTTDGGITWAILNSGTVSNLSSVHFPDLNTGYAAASDGTIIKTADAGNTWTVLNSGTTETLKTIFFTSQTDGIAAGGSVIPGPRNSYHSFLTRTTDGGITWIPYTLPRNIPVTRVLFFNSQTGIAAGGHPDGSHAAPEGTVLITKDGGLTWTEVFYGFQAVNSFDFSDDHTTGIAIGNYGTIKTTDGGNSWNIISYDGNPLASLSLLNPDIAIGVGWLGKISKTLNGALSWNDVSKSLTNGNIASLQFINSTTGYAVVSYEAGSIIKTNDGGASWQKLSGGNTGNFSSLFFTNSATGYATAYNYPYSDISKTTDGGNTWREIFSASSSYFLRSIAFATSQSGVAVGDSGTILRTTNAGVSWHLVSSNTKLTLQSIRFFNNTRGVIVGEGGLILRTTDGGATWTPSNSGTSASLTSVTSLNANTGYASGYNGTVLKTNNEGRTWAILPTSYPGSLSDVYFTDENTGYVSSIQNGEILKTTDGGKTWNTLTPITPSALSSLYFPSPGTGFVSGDAGTLIKISTCDAIAGPTQVLKGTSQYSVPAYSGVTYQWSISGGGRLISSGTNANVNWITTGTFTLTCTPSTGKVMTLPVTVLNPGAVAALSSNENSENTSDGSAYNGINVFPNPSHGSFTVITFQEQKHSIRILNALGNEVFKADLSGSENSIKLPDNLKGVFYMQLNSDRGTTMQKIVVQ